MKRGRAGSLLTFVGSVGCFVSGCGGGSGGERPDAGEGTDAAVDAARPDGDPGDRTPPTVLSTSPSAGATGTSRGAVTITFSEPMEPSSFSAGALSATQGGAVAGNVQVDGAAVTFRPAGAGFRGGVEVVLTLSADVADLAGNRLGTPFVLRFTPAAPGLGPLQLLATIPAVGLFGPSPRLSVDDRGNAWAVWLQPTTVPTRLDLVGARFTPLGGWGPPMRLDDHDGGVATPVLAGDGAGRAIVTYFHELGGADQRFFRVYDPVANAWGLPAPFVDTSAVPWPVFEPAGNIVAFYNQSYMGRQAVWRTSLARGSLVWSSPMLLQSYSNHVWLDDVAASDDGHIMVLDRVDYLAGAETRQDLWSHAFDPALGWTTPQRVEQQDVALSSGGIAVGRGGTPAFSSWVENGRAWHNERVNGSWSTPTDFARPSGVRWAGSVVIGAPDGGGVAVLVAEAQPPAAIVNSVHASDYVAGVGWSAPVALEGNPDTVNAAGLDSDAGGNVRVLLLQHIAASGWWDVDMVSFDRQTRTWTQPVRIEDRNSAKATNDAIIELAPDGAGMILMTFDEPDPAGWSIYSRALR